MGEIFEKIMRTAKIAYALFDHDLFLQDVSKLLPYYAGGRLQKKYATLYDVFPELIGAEDKIQELLTQTAKKYDLEKLSRLDESGRLIYYTLTLLPHQASPLAGVQLICLVIDTTLETSLAQEVQQQRNEIMLLQSSLQKAAATSPYAIHGDSPHIQAVRRFIDKIASIKTTTILLLGESGTGKSLVARIIHQRSMDPAAPFVEINCASIPETLIESEVFGYEKGAFTNAFTSKKGLLEEADGGTLFLDEIGELSHSLQAKFLTFLETKRFRRLGSTREITVQVRIITATNRDLKQAVLAGQFREDLYYRLNVVSLTMPPLRDLGEDIVLLATHYMRFFSFEFGKKVVGFEPEAENKLRRYQWPGNVRELRNVIERAVIFAENPLISATDLLLLDFQATEPRQVISSSYTLPKGGISLSVLEKSLLQQALVQARGKQTQAAKLLGLSLDTFRYRLKKFDMDEADSH